MLRFGTAYARCALHARARCGRLRAAGAAAGGPACAQQRGVCEVTVPGGDGPDLVLETGRIAKLADGAVLATQGRTSVLATVVMASAPAEETFLPLTVEYQEKQFAFGQIPRSLNRREGMPGEHEILAARVIDRTLRPLFPKNFFTETQIIAKLLSYDPEVDPEALAITASSAALIASPVPFQGPAAAVRVGWQDGGPAIGMDRKALAASKLDLLYAGTRDKTVMIEVASSELPEDDLRAAFEFAHSQLGSIIGGQDEFGQLVGTAKRPYATLYPSADVAAATSDAFYQKAKTFWRTSFSSKGERSAAQAQLTSSAIREIGSQFPDVSADTLALAMDVLLERCMRDVYIEQYVLAKRDDAVQVPGTFRLDGRGDDEVRPLSCETDVLASPHGSSLFSRGDTQALCTVTLGPPHMTAISPSDGAEPKSFYLHYDFPPYCVNEVGKMGVNRRMVGHGALAEKAVAAVMPSPNDLAYSVRVTSEVTGSDGSSSMATVCGTTLALLDAGIAIPHVAGVSVGLVTPLDESGTPLENGEELLLTDILGLEDHFGDMDFKVAGTRAGVTAVQLDIKLNGVPPRVIAAALDRAKVAREHILDRMEEAMPKARDGFKDTAPSLTILDLTPDQRSVLLSNFGAHIKAIEAASSVRMLVEGDRDVIKVWAPSEDALDELQQTLDSLFTAPAKIVVGHPYRVRVTSVLDFGVTVEVLGPAESRNHMSVQDMDCVGVSGMVHISSWSEGRVARMEDVTGVGDELVLLAVDVDAAGMVRFSLKDVPRQLRQHIVHTGPPTKEVPDAAPESKQSSDETESGAETGTGAKSGKVEGKAQAQGKGRGRGKGKGKGKGNGKPQDKATSSKSTAPPSKAAARKSDSATTSNATGTWAQAVTSDDTDSSPTRGQE